MKLRYSISYFVFIICILMLYIFGYGFSNHYSVEQYGELVEEEQVEEIRLSNSDDVINEGFYLRIEEGFVTIYLYDNSTIYDKTDITVLELNQELQDELLEGKYIETESALYAFLENYSS